jgi:anti-sigma regulatory factor (Ser/Thr protein kinase)
LAAADREPGGLGLHLIRRLVDEVTYDYTNGQSRITVTKRLG